MFLNSGLCPPDQPEDGPQLFILLFGFHRSLLVAALDDVGVHVSAVIRLCSEDWVEEERSEDEASSQTAGERCSRSPGRRWGCVGASSSFSLSRNQLGAGQKAEPVLVRAGVCFEQRVRKFQTPGRGSAQLHRPDSQRGGQGEPAPSAPPVPPLIFAFFQLETGIRIYGGVAHLLYDCLAKQRQHQHYLKSIRLIDIPAVARLPPQQPEVRTR